MTQRSAGLPAGDAQPGGARRVQFLCTHNSSRSQMAEGLLRVRGGDRYAAFSAGTHLRAVHPLAIRAMAELGIDLGEDAGHRAKSLDEFAGQTFDVAVTVCDDAAQECPQARHAVRSQGAQPGAQRVGWV